MAKYLVALLCLFCFCCWWWLLLSSQPHLMLWHPKPKDTFAYSGDVRYHSWHARCKVKFLDFGPKIYFPQAFQLKEVRGMVVALFYLILCRNLIFGFEFACTKNFSEFWVLCSHLVSDRASFSGRHWVGTRAFQWHWLVRSTVFVQNKVSSDSSG